MRTFDLVRLASLLILTVATPSLAYAYTATDVLQRGSIDQAIVSPDGQFVSYTVSKDDITANRTMHTLYVMSVADHRPRAVFLKGRSVASVPQASIYLGGALDWLSDDSGFLWSASDGTISQWDRSRDVSRTVATGAKISRLFSNAAGIAVIDLAISPDRKWAMLAITATGKIDDNPMHGVDVDLSWDPPEGITIPAVIAPKTETSLVLLNLTNGAVRKFTPDDLDVATVFPHAYVDWSPDSKSIAFSAATLGGLSASYMRTTLYAADVASGAIRVLVKQPGVNTRPIWSPDGRKIAFITLGGKEDWNYNWQIGVIDVTSAQPAYWLPAGSRTEDPHARSVRLAGWSSNGQELYFVSPVGDYVELQAMNAETGVTRDLVTKPGFDVGDFDSYEKARSADVLVVRVADFNSIPDLYLWRSGASALQRLTNENPAINDHPAGDIEDVAWPSTDGKWELHGILITPKNTINPPLIVYAMGGPSVVTPFSSLIETNFPFQAVVNAGFAIFVPNTRGREGFGETFHKAFYDEGNINKISASDIVSGVEYLRKTGKIRTDHIGIKAFSYGGGMSVMALVTSKLFHAASIHESVNAAVPTYQFDHQGPDSSTSWPHIWGATSSFDPVMWPRVLADSPILEADKIRTPTLLEYGVTSMAAEQGRPLFQALQFYHVPSELVIYPRTGHGITEPALVADSFHRNMEWFDYWLRGIATPRMAARYGSPATVH